MEEDYQAHLEARVARLQDDTGLTGAVAAVMTDGRLVGAAASGERRRGSGIPVTVDDRWHIGSITKSITATLLAVLEDDGLLSADDTVSALLPEVDVSDGWGACTLHHLLAHTAGAPANFSMKVQSVGRRQALRIPAAGARIRTARTRQRRFRSTARRCSEPGADRASRPVALVPTARGPVRDTRRQLAGNGSCGRGAHDDR